MSEKMRENAANCFDQPAKHKTNNQTQNSCSQLYSTTKNHKTSKQPIVCMLDNCHGIVQEYCLHKSANMACWTIVMP
jgi:hypothetical protein